MLLPQRQNQILTSAIRFGKLFKIAQPSIKAGLRNQDTAELTWDMLTDAEGNLGTALHLRDEASSGAFWSCDPAEQGTA